MIDFRKLIIVTLSILGFWVLFMLARAYAPSWLFWTVNIILSVGGLLYISYEPKKEPQRRYYLLVKHVVIGETENGITQTKVIFARVSCIGTLNLPKSYFDDMGVMTELTCMEVDRETYENFGEKAKELEQSNNKDNGLE